jgi:hypothetical protein
MTEGTDDGATGSSTMPKQRIGQARTPSTTTSGGETT